ncbi:MAG: ComEC/Rec2 family competence protein, partial [Thermodesulfobacteriota bacterium]
MWSGRSPRPVWAVLGATISAQMAVAPLLFLWFGSVALLAPVSNLLAAPLVAASTAVGGIGAVTGWNVAIAAGGWLAGVVLGIAHVAAGLPRVSRGSAVPVAAVIALCIRYRWLRPVGAVAAIVIVAVGIAPTAPPDRPVVAFLDVGQGDATMFRGPDGETILVDGGPDPLLLRRYLSEFGIGHIDLLVISHR